jgi:hypothetical protein
MIAANITGRLFCCEIPALQKIRPGLIHEPDKKRRQGFAPFLHPFRQDGGDDRAFQPTREKTSRAFVDLRVDRRHNLVQEPVMHGRDRLAKHGRRQRAKHAVFYYWRPDGIYSMREMVLGIRTRRKCHRILYFLTGKEDRMRETRLGRVLFDGRTLAYKEGRKTHQVSRHVQDTMLDGNGLVE